MPTRGPSKARRLRLCSPPVESPRGLAPKSGSLLPRTHRMFALAVAVAVAPFAIGFCAYVVYPAILWITTRVYSASSLPTETAEWPSVTITVPVYNAVSSIRNTLHLLMDLDYPRDRLQVLVLSDASTDGTDDVVRGFATRGVELVRATERRGKTAAENAALSFARGEIIVNVDATVAVPRDSLKALVRPFADPSVGVASGRDVSVDLEGKAGNRAEAGYVGYEMWLRGLETRFGSIVGASGCFFAIRRQIHSDALPPELSWDFASALVARQKGYRAVSVPEARCLVPRATSIEAEFRRKARTMARGLSTLFHFSELMNPIRYGSFAFSLISHKLLRWLPYLLSPFSLVALAILATQSPIAAFLLIVLLTGVVCGVVLRDRDGIVSRPLAVAAFAVAAVSAGLIAWYDAMRGERMVTWSPTQRPGGSIV